jgi:hypothetical protein
VAPVQAHAHQLAPHKAHRKIEHPHLLLPSPLRLGAAAAD